MYIKTSNYYNYVLIASLDMPAHVYLKSHHQFVALTDNVKNQIYTCNSF